MAKGKSTTSSSKGFSVVSHKKGAGGKEQWAVRVHGGKLSTWTMKASSAAAMDQAVKRYSTAMKRLAKR